MKKILCLFTTVVLVAVLALSTILVTHMFIRRNDTIGEVRLNVETYLAGKNQPTHPSVVVFEEPWNGYHYWMAYSPYPNADGEEENPCVAVSNDLYDWSVPYGLANPIADNEETNCAELKDPHILYREDLDRLEIWYLGRVAENLGGNNNDLILFRKYSTDGVNWSAYEVMDSVHYLSPSVYWNKDRYQMWSIGYDMWETTGTVVYQESKDGVTWSDPVFCSIGGQDELLDIWHGSVSVYEGTFHFVYIGNTEKDHVYYTTSKDGVNFENSRVIVKNDGWWRNLYRPTLVMEDDHAACIYGVINEANEWYLSMSTGERLEQLQGIEKADVKQMHEMPEDVTDTKSVGYIMGQMKDAFRSYFRLKLLVVLAGEVLLCLIFRKLRASKLWLALLIGAHAVLTGAYIFLRLTPSGTLRIVSAIASFVMLNMVAFFVLSYVYLVEKNVRERKQVIS